LFVAALKNFLTHSRLVDALLLGSALGLGLVTKYSLVPLLPACVLIVIVHWARQLIRNRASWLRGLTQFWLMLLVAYLILISCYAFQIKRIDADISATIASWLYLTGTSAAVFKKMLVHVPLMLPHYFIYGIDMVVQDSREGRTAFLLGRVSETGWWYYFPVALALKTTIPFLLTSVCGVVWAVVQVFARKRYILLYVLVPVFCFLGLSMTSHMDIGVRHILPIFPFLAIASGAVICATAERLSQYRNALASVFVLILLVLPNLLIAIFSYSNYLTYFSPLAGGSSAGWTKLSDSNVETGQEVKTLARYLQAHGEKQVTGMLIGGEFLNYYGVEFLEFPGWYIPDEADDEGAESDSDSHRDETNSADVEMNEGTSSEEVHTKYVAIGAWYFAEVDLTGKQEEIIDIYKNQKPEAMVGNSIFVFRKR
jgi:4-amino-4-deoxy-L-arabinose transferase-like glycosyltransferase